jgi:hypothetical protein
MSEHCTSWHHDVVGAGIIMIMMSVTSNSNGAGICSLGCG